MLVLSLIILLLTFSSMPLYAGEVEKVKEDSLRISLLTCSPGEELYTMFGHSGIRVRNVSTGMDLVFNYGMFNYDADNFIYRFVKGETDYELGAEYADGFFSRYARKGHEVVEQTLNLTAEQKRRLTVLLFDNHRPENRVYRYNFLYDNCTTRARDVIERSIGDCGGRLFYEGANVEVSFREILHEFTRPYPWAEFGIDMLLGEEVDKLPTRRQVMFIPSYFENEIDNAVVSSGSLSECSVPLLLRRDVMESADRYVADECFLTPNAVFWFLFVFTLALCVVDVRRRKVSWWWDAFLMTCQGLAGVLVAFLFFFSEHPAVGSNWLIVVFNPLPLVAMWWVVRSIKTCRTCWVSSANLAVLLLFALAMPVIPQSFNPSMTPLVLTLLLRALCGEVVVRKHVSE